MTGETSPERDTSLDGTLADLLIRGELQENMKFIFPQRKYRLLAYGKLVVAPIIRHPLRCMQLRGFSDEKGKQIQQKFAKDSIEWTLEGDRCSQEARQNLQAALAIESAFEDLPDLQAS